MAVFVALVIGVLVGLLARPVLDAYLSWKTAALWRDAPVHRVDDHPATPALSEETFRD